MSEEDNIPDEDIEENEVAEAPETPAPISEQAAAPVAAPAGAVVPPQGAPEVIPPKPEKSSSPPDQNVISVLAHRSNPADDAMARTAQDMAFHDDLNHGRIVPKTISDLYHNEKTVTGKIGTLFGLLVAGAGSGLTHQPNAVLEMMNNEINRDLDAQKHNQQTKQNWYKLAQEHENSRVENKYKEALTGKVPTDIAATQAATAGQNVATYGAALKAELDNHLNKQVGVQDLTASTTARNSIRLDQLQRLQTNINNMPIGPIRENQQAQLDNVVKPAIMKQNADDNMKLEQKRSLVAAMNPSPIAKGIPNDPRGPAIDRGKFDRLVNLGRAFEVAGKPAGPGAIPSGQVPQINTEVKERELLKNNMADADDSFRQLAAMRLAGQVPGASGASSLLGGLGALAGGASTGGLGALAGGVAGNALSHGAQEGLKVFEAARNTQIEALAKRLGGNDSYEAKKNLVDSLLPAYHDTDAQREEKYRKLMQHFNSLDNFATLEQYGLKNPLPKYEFKMSKEDKKEEKKEPTKSPEKEVKRRDSYR